MEVYAVETLDIDDIELNRLCLLTGLDKQYKINKFVNKMDKIRTLLGDILVRTVISKKLKTSNKYMKFQQNKYGKPYLKENENLNFNISHSGKYVVCAFDDKPIGIDVEEIKYIEYKEIAEKFFTAEEFQYIVNEKSTGELNRFYEIWTLKESYIKCCGKGLSIPLKSFSIKIDSYEDIKVSSDNNYKECVFKIFDIGSKYKISVCSLNQGIPKKITMIDPNSLISSGNYLL